MFEAIGGRKFIACLTSLVIGVVFFALGRMSEPALVDLVKWTLIVYIGGNVASDVATMFSRNPPPPPAT